MERSDSRILPEIKQNLQVGSDLVGIFGSLRLVNDVNPSIHNSDINAEDGESSMNNMSRTILTTKTTSDQNQSFLNGSVADQMTGGLQEFTSANSFRYGIIGESRVGGSEGKDIIWENLSSRARKNYSNDQGSSSDVHGTNPFSFNNPFFEAMEQIKLDIQPMEPNLMN